MQTMRDGVALGYDEAGRGDPPVILIHGWGTDRTLMQPLFVEMQGRHKVVSVDLRGFGASAAPVQSYTIAGHADDLAFLIAQLGLQRPIVIGHSMGGMIALEFAARHGDQIAAAIILEGMVVAAEAVLDGLRRMLDDVRSKDGHRDFVARLMTHLAGPHFDPGACARLLATISACPQHVLIAALEGIIAFDSVAAAARVTCPLLYLGTNATYADLGRLRELCPQLVTGQLVGCGHYFPVEVPAQVNAMIARFIRIAVVGQSR
jgi:pimeloyl-ACP methyl ester carboxylesterase